MIKIGILTFHRSVNNGAVIQAYSLSKRIAIDYPDCRVEIIDYNMKKITDYYRYSIAKYLKSPSIVISVKRAIKLFMDPGMIRRLNKRTKLFEQAIDLLPLSERHILSDQTDELYNYINKTYDVLIVGSDAVWNYVIRGFPNAYLTGTEVKCIKMSYAASCYGMEYLEYSKGSRNQIKAILDDFSFIGVRDGATEDFVKWSGCGTVPMHTCDPTAFLNIDNLPIDKDIIENKLKKRGFDFSKATIGMMGNEKMCSMIRDMYGRKYQIVALYEYIRDADVNLYDFTPYEWAYVFRYFKLVFTTYFHGTLLSLRNGVPLICISLNSSFEKKHTPKTKDVLQRVGYPDWYFTTDYKGKNYNAIKQKADELLRADIKEEIIKRINMESESYECFSKELSTVINALKEEKEK